MKDFREALKVKNRIPKEVYDKFVKLGWKFDDFAMELNYKGYPLVVEFCIGDFCTYPCSKKGHWLLEPKFRAENIFQALIYIEKLKERIDRGEKWKGEND